MDITLYSCLGLVSCLYFSKQSNALQKAQSKLLDISSKPLYTTSNLLNKIKEILSSNELIDSNFKKNDIDSNIITGKGFIHGLASSEYSIPSKIKQNTDLLYSDYRIETIYSNDYKTNAITLNYKDVNKNEKLINSAPFFYLKDYDIIDKETNKRKIRINKNDNRCRVYRNLEVNARSALRLIGSKVHEKKLSLFEKLIIVIYYLIELLSLGNIKFKGVSIGHAEYEYGILNNSILNVYGRINYDIKKNKLFIDCPEYFLISKLALINRMKSQIKRYKFSLLILLIPIIISIYKLTKICKELYLRRNRFNQEMRKNKLKMKELIIEDFKCLYCNINIINLIVLPCEHFCLCKSCYQNNMEGNSEKKCPKCKIIIKEVEEIFLP